MKKKIWIFLGVAVLVVALGVSVWFVFGRDRSAYEIICNDGYQGTAEEFVAALVGEQHSPGIEVSAYALACEKGYEKGFSTWIETLTGETGEDPATPAFTVVCENGYTGTLSQWLDTLVPNPEKLGLSKGGAGKTDYMLACDYGFEGSFTEWMVSLANETIVE